MKFPAAIVAAVATLVLATTAFAQQQRHPEPDIAETLEAGSTDHEVELEIVNRDTKPARGVTAAIVSKPDGVVNARIEPGTIAEIAPGGSASMRLLFDIAKDAESGVIGTIVLSFRAGEGRLSRDSAIVSLAIDGTAGEGGPHVFKLVRIDSLEKTGETQRDGVSVRRAFSEANTTLTYIRDATRATRGQKRRDTQSVGFDSYPRQIKLGEPFRFEASMVTQRDIGPGPCTSAGQTLSANLKFSLQIYYGTYGQTYDSIKKDVHYRIPDCKIVQSAFRSTQTVNVGSRISAVAQCEPRNREFSQGSLYYYYDCKISATDGEAVLNSRAGRLSFWLSVETDKKRNAVKDKDGNHILRPPTGDYRLPFHVLLTPNTDFNNSSPVRLTYEPVYTQTETLEGTGTAEHPVAVNNSVQEGGSEQPDGQQTAADRSGGSDASGTGSGGDAASGSGGGARIASLPPGGAAAGAPANPAAVNPTGPDVAGHIHTWLRSAEPPENAKGGAARYNEWGQVEGRLIGGRAAVNARPDVPPGTTPEQHVWSQRDALDSVDHCTVGEYVMAKLAGRGIEHCRGRYGRQPRVAAIPPANTVPDFAGMPAATAKTQLAGLGIQPTWRAGSTPDDPDRAGTIEKQVPPPGTPLAGHRSVELWVYRGQVRTVTVPDVKGLPYARAEARLKQAGLTPALGMTHSLRFNKGVQEGTVSSQSVRAGDAVALGTTVSLNVYGSAGRVSVPAVAGLHYSRAAQTLRAAGLEPRLRLGPAAPSRSKEKTIQHTQPAAGAQVERGDKITLVVYNSYADPAQRDRPNGPGRVVTSSPGSASRSFNPNTPRQFECELRIASLPQREKKWAADNGKIADYYFRDRRKTKGYSCDHKLNGTTRTVVVHFVTSRDESAKNIQDICRNEISSRYGDKRAIRIYMNAYKWYAPTEAEIARVVGAANARRILEFHAKQVIPYSVPCP